MPIKVSDYLPESNQIALFTPAAESHGFGRG
jgi:hypothetical protein